MIFCKRVPEMTRPPRISAGEQALPTRGSAHYGAMFLSVLAAVFLMLAIAPRTLASRLLENWVVSCLQNWGVVYGSNELSAQYAVLLFYVGVSLLCVLTGCLLMRLKRAGGSVLGSHLLPCGIAAFGLLCAFHPRQWTYGGSGPFEYWWIGYLFAFFLMVCLFLDRDACRRLVVTLAVVIGLQSVYAIVYWALGIEQFHTPHFGNRTAGTFANPNTLYPLCAQGVLLSCCLAAQATTWTRRAGFALLAAAPFVALALTFSRGGALALAAGFAWLYFRCSRVSTIARPWRICLLCLAVLLILGAVFARTKGRAMGAAEDRSFWGRIQVWRVALLSLRQSPWIGGGLGSYADKQRAFITPELQAFHPLNVEPKNLYLYIVAEVGVLGCVLLGGAAWGYSVVNKDLRAAPRLAPIDRALLHGTQAGMLALCTAGLVDTPIIQAARLPSTLVLLTQLGVAYVLVTTRATPPAQRLKHVEKEYNS